MDRQLMINKSFSVINRNNNYIYKKSILISKLGYNIITPEDRFRESEIISFRWFDIISGIVYDKRYYLMYEW